MRGNFGVRVRRAVRLPCVSSQHTRAEHG
jgi:hypothetical protein